MRLKLYSLLLVLTLPLLPATSWGQVEVGPVAGYDTEAQAVMLGAEGAFGFSLGENFNLTGNPSFGYYFVDAGSLISIDFDAHYQFPVEGSATPYAGAGLALRRVSVDLDVPDTPGVPGSQIDESHTDLALNLLGGARFDVGGAYTPFAELKVTAAEGSTVALLGGILFEL